MRWSITGHKITASAMGEFVCLFVCLFACLLVYELLLSYSISLEERAENKEVIQERICAAKEFDWQ